QDFSPREFQGHLPHPDRGRQCGDGARPCPNSANGASRSRPASSSRSAGCTTCRSLLCQQARPRSPRPVRSRAVLTILKLIYSHIIIWTIPVSDGTGTNPAPLLEWAEDVTDDTQ